MTNTYACKLVSNPNVPIFLPRVCTLVLFIAIVHMMAGNVGLDIFFNSFTFHFLQR